MPFGKKLILTKKLISSKLIKLLTSCLGLASTVTTNTPTGTFEEDRQSNVDVDKDEEQSNKDVYVIYGSYPQPEPASASVSSSYPTIQTFTVGPNGRSNFISKKDPCLSDIFAHLFFAHVFLGLLVFQYFHFWIWHSYMFFTENKQFIFCQRETSRGQSSSLVAYWLLVRGVRFKSRWGEYFLRRFWAGIVFLPFNGTRELLKGNQSFVFS